MLWAMSVMMPLDDEFSDAQGNVPSASAKVLFHLFL